MNIDLSVYNDQQITRTDLSTFSFIGKGIIPCPPPKIWEVLKDPENAYRYNNMLQVKYLDSGYRNDLIKP